jgi:energy-coupling factor transporter ATP-binding protein EcfA2
VLWKRDDRRELKRLEIARALATRPRLLLLDEVMAGLNPAEIDEIMVILADIRRDGIALLIVEHVMRAIMSLSDRIVVMANGRKIAEGLPAAVAALSLRWQQTLRFGCGWHSCGVKQLSGARDALPGYFDSSLGGPSEQRFQLGRPPIGSRPEL